MKLTLFSWGYFGWGNSIPQLLRATSLVEKSRGFEPPIFVDIRMNRAVRAIGFRENALEKRLGHSRYRWMRSLGNKSIGTNSRKININCPHAVDQLIDLALDAQLQKRRIIFFCGCEFPCLCHRNDVVKLAIQAAKRRKIPLQVVEWPGGAPNGKEQIEVNVKADVYRGLINNTRKNIILPAKELSNALSFPWGTIIRVKCGDESVPVTVGPAVYTAGRWSLPVYLTPISVEDSASELHKIVLRERKKDGYGIQKS